ncbi:hypothetical protein GCM10029963_79710 [Micromonospora andamanensis]|uniref:hypothetical protein n=1 Tax=Micromonospora andamanensis TaxID=1287068 RepID=UPI00194FB07F|nr:hypothetical protein [Micromonospora andamanensis]GIJ40544.1 hypothetical protein Vwe01_38690 [Micromonospora andamanensis]
MSQHTAIPAREIDHNDQCVGCGAAAYGVSAGDPCEPLCPFETGDFGPAVVLRAANRRVLDHPAGVGYDIAGAIFAAAVDLVGRDQAQALADESRQALADYLVGQWGPKAQAIHNQVVYRHGLFAHPYEIATSLYGAADQYDGNAPDPDDC